MTDTSNRSQLQRDARDRARAAFDRHEQLYAGAPGAMAGKTAPGAAQ